MSFGWTLVGRGWAECTLTDDDASAQVVASFIGAAPEDLLGAVTRVTAGEPEARAEFDAEPAISTWTFRRDGDAVLVRIVRDGGEVWATRQRAGDLARAVIRGFDHLAWTLGEDGYEAAWGRPFPRRELEALRSARRDAGHR